MAGIRKKKTESGKIEAWFIDYTGKRCWFKSTESPKITLARAIRLEEEHRQIRLGHRPAPEPEEKFRQSPVVDIIQKYFDWGTTQGGRGGYPWTPKYVALKKIYLEYWIKHLHAAVLDDLREIDDGIYSAISDLHSASLSPRTVCSYVAGLRAFLLWLVSRGYLAKNPMPRIQKIDSSPRVNRRALTDDEIQRLLAHCAPQFKFMVQIALASGLREKEIRSLKVKNLDTKLGGLWLEATWTKNRKPGYQPIPRWLADSLREQAAGKDPEDPLIDWPKDHAWDFFSRAIKKAGIPKWTPEGKIDFHALRVTYITNVIESGANIKEAQTLARHSNPMMTANIYAKTKRERLAEVSELVGEKLNQKCGAGVVADNKNQITSTEELGQNDIYVNKK